MIQPKENTNRLRAKPPTSKYEALPTQDSTSPLQPKHAFGGSKDFQFIDEGSDDDELLTSPPANGSTFQNGNAAVNAGQTKPQTATNGYH